MFYVAAGGQRLRNRASTPPRTRFWIAIPSRSELQFQSKLNVTWRVGARDLAGRAACYGRAGSAEVRMIEEVEKLLSKDYSSN